MGRWSNLISRRRVRAEVCAPGELPDVVTGPEDLDCFARGRGRANFVTNRQTSGPVHAALAPSSPPPRGGERGQSACASKAELVEEDRLPAIPEDRAPAVSEAEDDPDAWL